MNTSSIEPLKNVVEDKSCLTPITVPTSLSTTGVNTVTWTILFKYSIAVPSPS